MTPKLSPRTTRLIETLFQAEDADEASQWIEEDCGNNLPFCNSHDEIQMERIRFAAIKLSKGNLHKLLRAIDEARMDWRDLLMAADFGIDVQAHDHWASSILGE